MHINDTLSAWIVYNLFVPQLEMVAAAAAAVRLNEKWFHLLLVSAGRRLALTASHATLIKKLFSKCYLSFVRVPFENETKINKFFSLSHSFSLWTPAIRLR